MTIKDLLPIGSVVLLEEGKKKVMIIGVKQMNGDTRVEYDYLAVLYPEGYIADSMMFFFNHDAIAEVYHMGYRNQEHDEFRRRLTAFYERRSEEASE